MLIQSIIIVTITTPNTCNNHLKYLSYVNFVTNHMYNYIRGELLNNCLISYMKIFYSVKNKKNLIALLNTKRRSKYL